MKMKCLACGVEKETSLKEIYPFPEDGIISNTPVQPLFAIDCQGLDWRVAIVCHACFHKLNPDMWISDRCWLSLNPIPPFEDLPLPLHDGPDRFDIEGYGRLAT